MSLLRRLWGGARWEPKPGDWRVVPQFGLVELKPGLGDVWSLEYERGDARRLVYRNGDDLRSSSRVPCDAPHAQKVLDGAQPSPGPTIDRQAAEAELRDALEASPPLETSAAQLRLAYEGLRSDRSSDRVLLKRLENLWCPELARALGRPSAAVADELRARFGWPSRALATLDDVWVPPPPEPAGEEVPLGFFEVGEWLAVCDPASADRGGDTSGVSTCLRVPAVPGRWKVTAKGSTRLAECGGLLAINAEYSGQPADDEPESREIGFLGIDSGGFWLIDDDARFDDEFVARITSSIGDAAGSLGGHGVCVTDIGDGTFPVTVILQEGRAAALVVRW